MSEELPQPPETPKPLAATSQIDPDPAKDSADIFERLLGAPHKNLETALAAQGHTLDRLFHRFAITGGGSKAKEIDLVMMELALATQKQFRSTYDTIKRGERAEHKTRLELEKSRYGF